jgi:hypothetical protein
MSDAALSEPRAAALESSGPSDAMKPSASKAWQGWRADVGPSAAAKSMEAAAGMESPNARKTWGGRRADMDSCSPAKPMEAAAGMESPDARKTWGGRRADMDSCSPAKPMEAAAGVETSDARKTWGGRGADMDSCGPAKPMQTAAASKAGRDWRPDVGNSGAVKVMKIAAAKAAVESAAGKTGGDGRGAGVEIRCCGNAACAKAMQAWGGAESMKGRSAAGTEPPRRLEAWVNGVQRPGIGNDHAVVMMAPDRGAAKGVEVERADPTKTIVPLVAALIPAAAVPPVGVVAIAAAELDGLHRQ